MNVAPLLLALFLHLGPAAAPGWPLDPRPDVVARFDPPASRWGAGHRGVDLRGTTGERVRTAEAGVVRFAGRIAGRGVVVVDHGDTRTTYEPVRAGVRVGQQLAAGAVIGTLELFGSHCFPAACLHWGLIEGADTYLDPLSLLGAAPVRLLPLSSAAVTPAGAPGGTPDGAGPW
jgi:murein DD-endopeptidase MepM/ murein hydrolase activator NlpD